MAHRQIDPADPTGEFPIDPAGYFLHLMLIINRRRDARVEQLLRPLNMTVDGHRAMRIIHIRSACTMGELADYAIIDRTTLTRIVDRLVSDGLVDRSKPPGDRRKIVLTLTESGLEAYNRARRVIGRFNVELTRGLDEADFRIAARLQQRIVARVVEDEELAQRLMLLEGDAKPKSGRGRA